MEVRVAQKLKKLVQVYSERKPRESDIQIEMPFSGIRNRNIDEQFKSIIRNWFFSRLLFRIKCKLKFFFFFILISISGADVRFLMQRVFKN